MNSKKFTILFVVVWLLLLFTNFSLWKFYTEVILSNRYEGGDMARVGYVSGSKIVRNTYVDLPKQHIEMSNYTGQKIDVLTIGDSFSHGGGFGKNSYYQDYIASINDFTVLNAGPYPTDDLFAYFQPLSTLLILYNSGYLDVIKPRYLLIESISRYAIKRFAKKYDFLMTDSFDKVKKFYAKPLISKEAPSVFFFNDGNYKFVKNSLLYNYSDTAFTNNIHVRTLEKEFFSVKNSKKLLFFNEDITYMKETTPQKIRAMNDNLNHIAEMLDVKGIKLIFMPIVDKYDLYSQYIVNNPYPENIFFNELKKHPKKYILIDTKEILSELIKKGEKDVYFPDDAHWNWKASKFIFENVKLK